ncbi:MAG TPA: imelysin family protein [Kofleriaceae bacterium]
MRQHIVAVVALAAIATGAACAEKTDAEYRAEIAAEMHTEITRYLADLVAATRALQVAAPDHGWNAVDDDPAITRMRDAWKDARVAWENVEGAIAPMFAGLDESMDARYEELLPALGPQGDQYLFDNEGVIGMHAIERILYKPYIRLEVVNFERSLPGYLPAEYPTTDDDAITFKTQLVQRLVDDAIELQASWRPEDVDIATAYKGLVDLMKEQQSKVDLAVTGEEESRYSNITLLDLRNNLIGTSRVYELFREWIHSKTSAAELSDRQIVDKLSQLHDAYTNLPTDSLPAVPAGWSSQSPSADVLATPFGALWLQIRNCVDPQSDGSVVHEMNSIAQTLGFSKLTGIDAPPAVHTRRSHRR